MSKSKNQLNIACPSCGVENSIASPFCKECGDRMYKEGASPGQLENPRKVAKRHAFRSFVNAIVFLTLVAVIGLALWPYPAVDVPVANDRSRQVERFLEEVRKRRASGTEVPTAVISQRNLNAFLGQNSDSDARKLLGTLLSESRILLIANEPVGPFNISTRLVLAPVEEEQGPFVPENFLVGHLPLPVAVVPEWTKQLADRFDLNLDPEVWEEMRIEQVTQNGVVLEIDQQP